MTSSNKMTDGAEKTPRRKSLIASLIAGTALVFSFGCATDGGIAKSARTNTPALNGPVTSGDDGEKMGPLSADQVDKSTNTVFAPLAPDEKTVENVEPIRYLGKWYEIATYPIVFQLLCVGSTAEYSYVDPSTIGVRNQCALGTIKGPQYAVDGYARILDSDSNARLSVAFGKKPTNFGAPYWVIELDGSSKNGPYEKYEWAVVGGPSKKNLWILSRTPQLDQQRLQLILDRLAERGYDLSKLKFTAQPQS